MSREMDSLLRKFIAGDRLETVQLKKLRYLLGNVSHWTHRMGLCGLPMFRWAHREWRRVETTLRTRGAEIDAFYGPKKYRWEGHPEERAFAEAWAARTSLYIDARGHHHIDVLMAEDPNASYISPVSPEARLSAAAAIQWLGSPNGQNFLYALGYRKMEESDE